MKDISPALMRAYGFLGFMTFGLGSIYFGNKIFGFGLDIWNLPFSGWGGKGMIMIVLSMVLALIGMFIGWGIGASIKIHDRVEGINPILLYGANGSFMWMFSFTVLSLVILKEGANEIMLLLGSIRLFLFMMGIGILGSLLVSLMIFLAQYFRK